ncbi:MAG: hypothetical protein ACI4SB_09190, partial [Acutalibacteraceae bacterium]
MADTRNDPSSLYDEDFMRKREQMFGKNSENVDVDSGRHDDEDYFSSDEQSTDVFSEKNGFLSKFRRSSKSKRRGKKDRDFDDDDGYDIFELEDLQDDSQKDEKSGIANEKASDKTEDDESLPEGKELDDINALLESVGIKPIDHNEQQEKEETVKSFNRVKDKIMEEAENGGKKSESEKSAVSESDTEKEKTKYFSIGKQSDTQDKPEGVKTAPDKTLVNGIKPDTEEKEKDKQPDGQLILDGYVDEQKPKTVSEEKAVADLKQTRKNLIDNFRVLAKSG